MWPKLSSSSSSPSSSSSFSDFSTAEEKLAMSSSVHRARSSFNVEEEYNNALRTKSFIDIWDKTHHQLNRNTPSSSSYSSQEAAEEVAEGRTGFSPLSLRYYAHLPDFVLDPSQETLIAAADDDDDCAALHHHHHRHHALLLDYFDATRDACNACASLLACIDRTRTHHRSLRRLLGRLCATHDHRSALSDLASHARLDNPLSTPNLASFNSAHARCGLLLRRLAVARRRIVRRARLLHLTKKASGIAVVAACGVVAVAAIVVATHGVAALAAVPVAVMGFPQAAARWVRRRRTGAGWVERAAAQVEAAARGVYIIGRDLDTVSRMVRRLSDEVEHCRDVILLVLRNSGEQQLAREVAREVEFGEAGFVDQLAELEEHVYLCLLTINRSRRLVAQEMGGALPPPPAEV